MIFLFSPKNIAKILVFFTQTTFCKNFIVTLVFETRQFCRRKLAKNAENCDHNIDPVCCEKPKSGCKVHE
jgi:hypothetical protein